MKKHSLAILIIVLLAIGATSVFLANRLGLPSVNTDTGSGPAAPSSITSGASVAPAGTSLDASTTVAVQEPALFLKCSDFDYNDKNAAADCVGTHAQNGPDLSIHIKPTYPDLTKDGGVLVLSISSSDGSINQNISLPYDTDFGMLSARGSFALGDYNFDGYQDLAVPVDFGASNEFFDIWLFNPSTHKFVKEDSLTDLANVAPDPSSKTVLAHANSGGAGCYYAEETYAPGSDGHYADVQEVLQEPDDTATDTASYVPVVRTTRVLDQQTGNWTETVTHPTDCIVQE